MLENIIVVNDFALRAIRYDILRKNSDINSNYNTSLKTPVYRISSNGLANKTFQMAAQLDGRGGVVTHQTSGEEYTDYIKNQVKQLPGDLSPKVEKNILTAQNFDTVYNDFMASVEGQEFVKYLKMHGNGKPNPGSIEDIFVQNAGEGIVAATMPDHAKSNIILNADFISSYASMMDSRMGRGDNFSLKKILAHELHHYHGQPRKVRSWPEKEVEFHNDYSLVRFYVGLANKYPEESDYYLDSAKFFTMRYAGNYKKTMDSYIEKNVVKTHTAKDASEEYSKAA